MISKKQTIIIIVAAIIVLVGAGAAGYWYYQNVQKNKAIITETKSDDGVKFAAHPEAKFTSLTAKDLSADDYARYQAALETLQKQPGERGSLINLGYIFKKIGYLEDAKLSFTILATWDEIEPDPEGNLGLARVLVEQKNYKEASDTYYKILKTQPLYIISYKEILDMYEQKLIEIDPVILTYVNHARAFDKTGQYKQDLENIIVRYNEIKNRQ